MRGESKVTITWGYKRKGKLQNECRIRDISFFISIDMNVFEDLVSRTTF